VGRAARRHDNDASRQPGDSGDDKVMYRSTLAAMRERLIKDQLVKPGLCLPSGKASVTGCTEMRSEVTPIEFTFG
jgi:hypothetical protein